MNTNVISQSLKNLASDSDIAQMIPRRFNPLEVVAASTAVATEISRIKGKDDPDRHDYLEAVPKYLGILPQNVELAQDVIKMDAAKVLSIPGLATDQAILTNAQRELAEAQAKVDAAELIQGKRLSRIHRLEEIIVEARREKEAWDIDFDAETASAEASILEHWGKTPVVSPFHALYQVEVLKRLQPKAVAAIKQRITEAETELSTLRGATLPEVKLTRGKQPLPA